MLLRQETISHSLHLKNSMAQMFELSQIIKGINSIGIDVLVLKGPVMSFELYGDVDSRVSKDIDLVVPRNLVVRVDEYIRCQGYIRAEFTPRQLESHRTRSKDFVYWQPQKRICLELHWRLFQDWECFDPFKVPHQRVFLGGQTFKTLSPEYNLLYLATHGCESGWSRPQWSQDIVMLLKKYGEQLDWSLIWREAERYDLTGPLEQALLWQAKTRELWTPHQVRGDKIAYVWRSSAWFSKIMLRKQWGNRFKAAWSLLVPRTQDFQALRLPDWLFFLYPLARPWLALARNRQRSKESSQCP